MTDKNFVNGRDTISLIDSLEIPATISSQTTITIHSWENVSTLNQTAIIAQALAEGFKPTD